jgi:DNA-binding transcriptional LysR family regulator
MNMRQIDVFRALMTAGSTVVAAQRLGISQPAVSKHLKEIEETIRLTLFERTAGRLLPTPEARLLFDHVDRMEIGLKRINRFIDDLRDSHRGRLSMFVMPLMMHRRIPDVLADFLKRHPRINVVLHSHNVPQVFYTVAIGEADLAIDVTGREHEDLKAEPLIDLEIACVLPARHRLASREFITAEDLADEDVIILRNLESYPVLLEDVMPPARVKFRRRIDVFQSVPGFQLISRGLGIGMIDQLTFHDLGHPDLVAVRFKPVTKLEVVIMTSKRWPTSNVAKAFIADLKRRFRALQPELSSVFRKRG